MFNTGLIFPRYRRGKISLIFLLIIIGCASIPSEKNAVAEIYFCAQDKCEDRIYDFLENAKSKIHCSFFNINLDKIISKLTEKSRKIDVKVIINNKNYKGQFRGENIRLSKRNNHNKFCVIDDNIVITGSFNPTKTETRNNNNLIALYSRLLAKNYEDEFDEQWHGLKDYGTSNKEILLNENRIVNLFCPDDDCIRYFINALKNANSSIYFMVYSLTNEKVADLMITKDVEIRGIFEDSQARQKYSQYERLKGFGLNVRLYEKNITLHHKVFIIDNSTVITGSLNPTNNGFFNNDENLVIIYDPEIAKKYLKEFDRLVK